jgi:Flp pilus assembly protein TadD
MQTKAQSNPLMELKDASSLLAQRRCPQAVDAFSAFVQKYPNDAGGFNSLGLAYLCVNNPDMAISSFQHALTLAPTFTDVHNNLGVAYMSKQNFPEAESEFKIALSDPGYPAAGLYYNLARLSFVKQDYEESRALARKAMMLSPKEPGPRLMYSLALERLGREDEAILSYNELLRLFPNNVEGCYYLAVLYQKRGRACDARELLIKVIDADPLGDLAQESIESLKTIGCPQKAH